MRVDLVAGAPPDLPQRHVQVALVDANRAAAARADEMVVMRRLAADVGVLPAGQVDPLDQVEAGQQLQRAEDGRPTEPGALTPRRAQEILGGEVALPLSDQACRAEAESITAKSPNEVMLVENRSGRPPASLGTASQLPATYCAIVPFVGGRSPRSTSVTRLPGRIVTGAPAWSVTRIR